MHGPLKKKKKFFGWPNQINPNDHFSPLTGVYILQKVSGLKKASLINCYMPFCNLLNFNAFFKVLSLQTIKLVDTIMLITSQKQKNKTHFYSV